LNIKILLLILPSRDGNRKFFRYFEPVLNNHSSAFTDITKVLVLVFKTGCVLLKIVGHSASATQKKIFVIRSYKKLAGCVLLRQKFKPYNILFGQAIPKISVKLILLTVGNRKE